MICCFIESKTIFSSLSENRSRVLLKSSNSKEAESIIIIMTFLKCNGKTNIHGKENKFHIAKE
jgi:hypothetical protein